MSTSPRYPDIQRQTRCSGEIDERGEGEFAELPTQQGR